MTDHITNVTRFLNDYYKSEGYVEPRYHNLKHIHGMHSIARRLGVTASLTEHEFEILDYACLFHDVLHTGGKESDSYNIHNAIILFRHYVELVNKEYLDTVREPVITDIVAEAVVRVISCTEFPFTREPETEVERCIRDADILYATLHSDPSVIMDDLRSEMEISQKRSISYAAMYEGQLTFMANLTLYTIEGRRLFGIHTPTYLAKMKAYV